MKNDKLQLEGICTANFDRSTTFEAVFREAAKQFELDKYIDIHSSGTKADKIRHLASPMKIRHQVIGLGHNLEVFDPDEYETVEKILKEGPDAETNAENRILYARALQPIRGLGGLYRGCALAELKIPVTNTVFKQTQAVDYMDVVLGMKPGNVKDAKKIYGSNGPMIKSFQEYAEAKEPVPDPMGKDLNAYRELVDYFRTYVSVVLHKTLDTFGPTKGNFERQYNMAKGCVDLRAAKIRNLRNPDGSIKTAEDRESDFQKLVENCCRNNPDYELHKQDHESN